MPYDRAALEDYLKQMMEGTINNGQMMPPDRTAQNALRALPTVRNPQDLGGPQNPGKQDFNANLQPDPNDPTPADDLSGYNDQGTDPDPMGENDADPDDSGNVASRTWLDMVGEYAKNKAGGGGGTAANATKPHITTYIKPHTPDRTVVTGAANLPASPQKRRGFDANFRGSPAMLAPDVSKAGQSLRNAPVDYNANLQPDFNSNLQPDPNDPQVEQAPEQAPPEAQVDNKNLADAVNLTGPGSEPQQAAQHAQDTIASSPPEDKSAYLAALKEVQASAFRSVGQQAPEGGLYDTLLKGQASEQQNYRALVAQALKQKFEGEQKGLDRQEKAREFALREKENALKEQDLQNYRDAQLKLGNRRADDMNLRINGIDERQANQLAAHSKLPDAGEASALNDVLATLEEGTAPGSGYFMNRGGWQNFLRTPEGQRFRVAVLSATNPEVTAFAGRNVTGNEQELIMGQMGLGTFDSPEALNEGMHRLAEMKKARVAQELGKLPPDAAKMLQERGAVPNFGGQYGHSTNPTPNRRPIENAPPGGSPTGSFNPQIPSLYDRNAAAAIKAAEDATPGEDSYPPPEEMGPDIALKSKLGMRPEEGYFEHVAKWLKERISPQEAVNRAKAMEDEEFRKRMRPEP